MTAAAVNFNSAHHMDYIAMDHQLQVRHRRKLAIIVPVIPDRQSICLYTFFS